MFLEIKICINPGIKLKENIGEIKIYLYSF